MSKKWSTAQGDCLEVLRRLGDNCLDSCVTDPPYGLVGVSRNGSSQPGDMKTPYGRSGPSKQRGFMGLEWDGSIPSVEIWKEVYRVLKPGGYLLAFAGTRTQHRMAVNIEDAGFEIRDMIAWMYGQGFPKSHDVSKAIDKMGGDSFMEWFPEWLEEYRTQAGVTRAEVAAHFTSSSGGITGCVWNWEHGIRTPSIEQFNKLCTLLKIPVEPLDVIERRFIAKRQGVTKTYNVGATETIKDRDPITAATSPKAVQWEGWGTALKPAMEPITVARKPLEGTVAANVLKYGTGAINIDGCRVATTDVYAYPNGAGGNGFHGGVGRPADGSRKDTPSMPTAGRFPANVIMDEEAGKILDEQSGVSTSAGGRTANISKTSKIYGGGKGLGQDIDAEAVKGDPGFGDTGGASRFFYCPKTNKKDRGEGNSHPTVKPTDLMRYLCRLVTPPEGIILDPFMGSGSTGKAAILEGFKFIGIEREAQYIEIAQKRLAEAEAT